jgi:hypothetical protein
VSSPTQQTSKKDSTARMELKPGDLLALDAAELGALRIDARRGAPPREVLDQMAAAQLIYDDLRAAGLRMRFSSPLDGPLEIALCGEDGAVRGLSMSDAVEIAAGRPAF